jgi:hypothetical protein
MTPLFRLRWLSARTTVRARRPASRPRLEALEDRLAPAIFTVANTNDSGSGSLRQAILNANAAPGLDTIDFAIAGSGVHTIVPLSALPAITDAVTIDGTSQPGFTTTPLIEIDGASAGAANGLAVTGGSSTIKDLVVNRFQYFGIALESNSNIVEGCWVGTTNTGAAAAGNGFSGIFVNGNSNTIGGTIAAFANVVSANGFHGVQLQSGAADNIVEGNFIGTNAAGTAALGNSYDGLTLFLGANTNVIGGLSASAANVISGNDRANISVLSPGTTTNFIEGNKIGTNAAGSAAVAPTSLPPAGSTHGIGVWLLGGATDNLVGGTASGASNQISGNATNGVQIDGSGTSGNVIEGNNIGLKSAGLNKLGNAQSGVLIDSGASSNVVGGSAVAARNFISGNGSHGVEIRDSGTFGNSVEGNDIGLPFSGSNVVGNTFDGVAIYLGAADNLVGTTANIIAENGRAGVTIVSPGTSGNIVSGNTIGDLSEPNAIGVWIAGGATGNTVGGTTSSARNLISSNTTYGVVMTDPGTNGNVVEGNYIGLDSTGTAPRGNGSDGVFIATSASGNTIGGTAPGSGNVVSESGNDGIHLQGTGTTGNLIQGNLVGTNGAGTSGLGNSFNGIAIDQAASSNTIGGTLSGAGNVIAGNGLFAVLISDAGTTGNALLGNTIGLSASGALIGNPSGVIISNGATNNAIGGTAPGSRNVIADNNDNVLIIGSGTSGNTVQGNYLGTNAAGTAAIASANSVAIFSGASNNLIGGAAPGSGNVIDTAGGQGIELSGAGTTGNAIQGNLIGTNAAGTLGLGNLTGIFAFNGASNTTIGGTTAGARNVISGNTIGIGIYSVNADFTVEGNFIGTNAAGTAAIPNQDGIDVSGAGSSIGGALPGARNVISGNSRFGINISGNGNTVAGNSIGVAADGLTALGNVSHGVFLNNGAASNIIGGTAAGAGNLIANNGGAGVLIGSDPGHGFNTAAGIGNSVLGNSIYNNVGLAIDLGPDDGVTANGFNGNVGPNDYEDFPVLGTAVALGSSTLVTGIVQGPPGSTIRVEFFSDPTADASGHGQGKTFLGFVNVFINVGQSPISVALPIAVPKGQVISTTATNPATGDTSEFSADITVN